MKFIQILLVTTAITFGLSALPSPAQANCTGQFRCAFFDTDTGICNTSIPVGSAQSCGAASNQSQCLDIGGFCPGGCVFNDTCNWVFPTNTPPPAPTNTPPPGSGACDTSCGGPCGYRNSDSSCTTDNSCCHRQCNGGGSCVTVAGGGPNTCDNNSQCSGPPTSTPTPAPAQASITGQITCNGGSTLTQQLSGYTVFIKDSTTNIEGSAVSDSSGNFSINNFDLTSGTAYAVRSGQGSAQPNGDPLVFGRPPAVASCSSAHENCPFSSVSGTTTGGFNFQSNPPTNLAVSCNSTQATYTWNRVTNAIDYVVRIDYFNNTTPEWAPGTNPGDRFIIHADSSCSGTTCTLVTTSPPSIAGSYVGWSVTARGVGSASACRAEYNTTIPGDAAGNYTCGAPTATPTPTPSGNYSWTINATPVCATGVPTANVRVGYRHWQAPMPPWTYDTYTPGAHTVNITDSNPARVDWSLRMQLNSGSTTIVLVPTGSPPAGIHYDNHSGENAHWTKSSLPSGTYNVNFLVPAAYCQIPTATPTFTPTPTICASSAPGLPTCGSASVSGAGDVSLNWTPPVSWGNACPGPNDNTVNVLVDSATPNPSCDTDFPQSTTSCVTNGYTQGTHSWSIRSCNGQLCSSYVSCGTFDILLQEKWFQTTGGSTHSHDLALSSSYAYQSVIPSAAPTPRNFILSQTGNPPGIASMRSGSIDLGVGALSSTNRSVVSPNNSRSYNYNSFVQTISANGSPDTNSNGILENGEVNSMLPNRDYLHNGSLTLDFSTWNIVSGQTFGIAVSGDLTIANVDINLPTPPNGDALVMFVVQGDIYIDPKMTDLTGIYLANGDIFTGSFGADADEQLVINGSLLSHSRLVFQRDLTQALEDSTPAESIIFRPDVFAAFPARWTRKNIKWSEVAP